MVVALHDVDLDLALARREEGALLDAELWEERTVRQLFRTTKQDLSAATAAYMPAHRPDEGARAS